MVTSSVGIALIKKAEGFRPTLYIDAKGLCIGYGCNLTKQEAEQYQGVTITEQQADQLLRQRLIPVELCLATKVRIPLNQNEFDALASLIYNIGVGDFAGTAVPFRLASHLLRKLNAGDKTGAAAEFPKWRKSEGKVLQALVNRRKEELALFLTPIGGQSV